MTSPPGIGESRLYRGIVETLPERMVVISKTSRIVATNMAWDRFGREHGNLDLTHASVGDLYLEACEANGRNAEEFARRAKQGITDVLCGAIAHFEMQYPCSSPSEEEWWEMQVFPIHRAPGLFAVVHRDVTEIRRLQEALRTTGSSPNADLVLKLAPRQRQVLELIAKGFSNKEIALTMGITTKTVDYHVKTLKMKLGKHRRAELVRLGS